MELLVREVTGDVAAGDESGDAPAPAPTDDAEFFVSYRLPGVDGPLQTPRERRTPSAIDPEAGDGGREPPTDGDDGEAAAETDKEDPMTALARLPISHLTRDAFERGIVFELVRADPLPKPKPKPKDEARAEEGETAGDVAGDDRSGDAAEAEAAPEDSDPEATEAALLESKSVKLLRVVGTATVRLKDFVAEASAGARSSGEPRTTTARLSFRPPKVLFGDAKVGAVKLAFEVRSIHWSPYDRVGVVNAVP